MAAERDSLAREMQARHEAAQRVREAGEHRRNEERQRAEKELREVELELAAVAPDAPALLDGFERGASRRIAGSGKADLPNAARRH